MGRQVTWSFSNQSKALRHSLHRKEKEAKLDTMWVLFSRLLRAGRYGDSIVTEDYDCRPFPWCWSRRESVILALVLDLKVLRTNLFMHHVASINLEKKEKDSLKNILHSFIIP